MLSSLKEAAAKQAAKLQEVLNEAAQQDAAARAQDRKQNAEADESDELKYLRMENEALKNRLRETMTPASDRETELEAQLAAKTAEHEKLAEKSRELMIRYRKLQAEKASVMSPDAKPVSTTSDTPSGASVDLERKLRETEQTLQEVQKELMAIKTTAAAAADISSNDATQNPMADTLAEDARRKDQRIEELETLSRTLREALQNREETEQSLREMVATLEQKVEKDVGLGEQIQVLEKECTRLSEEVALRDAVLADEKKHNEMMGEQLREASESAMALRRLETELRDTKSACDEISQKLRLAEDEVTTQRRRIGQLEEALEAQNDSTNAATGETVNVTNDLLKQISELQANFTTAVQTANNLQRQLDSTSTVSAAPEDLEREIAVRVQLDRAERQHRALQCAYGKVVALSQAEQQKLESRVKFLETELDRTHASEADLHTALERAKLVKPHDVSNSLGVETTDVFVSEEMIDLRVKLDRAERKMKSDFAEMDREMRALRDREASLKERLGHLEQSSGMSSAESRMNITQSEIDTATLQLTIAELTARLANAEEARIAQETRLAEMTRRIDEAGDASHLAEQVSTYEANARRDQAKLVELQSQVDSLQAALSAKIAELAAAQLSGEKHILDMQAALSERDGTLATLQTRIGELAAAAETTSVKNAQETMAHMNELQQLKDELVASAARFHDSQMALLASQTENIDLRVTWERLERQYAKMERSLLAGIVAQKDVAAGSMVHPPLEDPSQSDTASALFLSRLTASHEVELRVRLDHYERVHARSMQRIRDLESELNQLRSREAEARQVEVGSGHVVHELQSEINSLLREMGAMVAKEIELRVALDRAERAEHRAATREVALENEAARVRIELQKSSEKVAQAEQRLVETQEQLIALEAERQGRTLDIEKVRMEAMQGREALVQSLQEKERALQAAEETMKKLAAGFDEISAREAQLKRELEVEQVKVEEMELKMRTDFDKLKFELQSIFDEKAKQLTTKLEEAQQEAEAAHVACSGFQRQLKEAHEEVAKQTRELDSLRERTRDALLRVNEEKKDLQEKLTSLQAALERKMAEAIATAPLTESSVSAADKDEELETLQKANSELEEALELSRRVTESLKQEANTLRVELEAAQGIIKSTELNEQRFVQENARLKEEMVQLRQETRQRKERAEKMLAEKEAMIERLNEKLTIVHDPDRLRVTLDEEDALREENKQLQQQLVKQREEIEAAASDLALYKRKLADQQHAQHLAAPPAKHPGDPAAVYLKNVLLSYMCSRDPREQLGMVKAISQLAGFTPLETEKIRHVLEDADRGMLGKLMGTVLTFGTADPSANPPTSPPPQQASTPRVMKRVS